MGQLTSQVAYVQCYLYQIIPSFFFKFTLFWIMFHSRPRKSSLSRICYIPLFQLATPNKHYAAVCNNKCAKLYIKDSFTK